MADDGLRANTDFGERVIEARDKPTPPLHVNGVPYEEFMTNTDIPLTQGDPVPDAPIPTLTEQRPMVSRLHALQRAQIDGIIKGDNSTVAQDANQYALGVDTVEDELISFLEAQYNEEFIDQQVLKDIYAMPEEERLNRIYSEFNRLDSRKETTRNLLALNMMRQGLGQSPSSTLDAMWSQLQPGQVEALYEQRRATHLKELQDTVDRIAAEQGVGFTTGAALGEIIRQDILPFWGASTRILGTNKFLPEDLELSTWKKPFPGEVRQAIREWWVNASHQERKEYLNDIEETWKAIRKGPNSNIYTRYLVIENLMGTFTDELLQNDNPTETFDRVMGNLDTALGMLVAVGLVLKKGRSIFDIFTSSKENTAKNIADAGGSRVVSEQLDQSIAAMAKDMGMASDEAAIVNLPRPVQMELALDVETDSVVTTTVANVNRRRRVLEYTDQADITLLDDTAKKNAVTRVIDDIDKKDSVHLHHKMSTVRGLPDGVGVEVHATVGARNGEGWHDLVDLMDDMQEMDPYQEFTIWRRNKDGKLEELEISWKEIVDYYSTGRIPAAMDEFLDPSQLPDIIRHFGMRRLNKVSSAELGQALDSGWLDPASDAYRRVRKELNDRVSKAGPEADNLLLVDGEELFVRFKTEHYFDAQDMEKLDGFRWWDIPGLQSSFRVIGKLFPPLTKFDRLYTAARKTYHMEEAALAEFADILVPFDKLSTPKKRQVAEMIEWVEDYAKDMYHETGVARAPTIEELIGEFSVYDDSVFEGYLALKEAMDGLYDVFNRRLYRDFNNRGFRTMRGADDNLPQYHGVPLSRSDFQAGHYYDPVQRKMVELDAEEIAAILEEGGGAIKLDFAIDVPSGGKTTRVLARKGEYEIGSLNKSPLNYYEGYHFRFYEDPYFIIKRNYGATVDGVKLEDGKFYEEAIRTAPSFNEAKSFLGRGAIENGKGEWITKSGERFVIERSRDVNYVEGTLYQKQALHREGRLFWDSRNFERLPNTTGNRAKVSDPWQSMQKGLAMAMRQTTQEGLFKAMKVGFVNEFGDLPIFIENARKLKVDELQDLERELTRGVRSSSGQTKVRYKDAREYIRYMRSQMGTDSFAVPFLRSWSIASLEWLDTYSRGKIPLIGKLQRHALQIDPFSRARKIAYGAFMVLRPARQLLLQSMQVSMLTGLAPSYVGTGRVFFDGLALRRGLAKFRRGADDGWSDSKLADAMGLTKKEYKRLVEEFQRSGLLGSVNTHAFNASGKNLAAHLDPNAGPAGRMMYNVRARGRQVYNALSRGFEWGEQANLTYTYLIALRRAKKKFKVNDLTKFTREQWDSIVDDADALALGMTRPNKFAYQTGATGTMFQFLSFQHRALLTMLGMNPSIKGKDLFAIWGFNYLMWGSNIFGAEEWTREFLAQHGLSNWGTQEVMPGITMYDVMVAGIIDTGLNGLLNALNEERSNLDIGILAPGAAITQLYEGFYDLLTAAPTEMEMLGPVANQVSGFMKGWQFMRAQLNNQFDSPGKKIVDTAEFFAKEVLPIANDLVTTWTAYQLGQWIEKDGDTLGVQASKDSLIARGLFGIRTDEEMSLYRARELLWENEENIQKWVKYWRPVLKQVVGRWAEGEYDDTRAYKMASVILGLTEDAPEGVRREIYRRLMTEPDTDGKSVSEVVAELAAKGTSNIRMLEPHINNSTLTSEQKQMLQEFVDYVAEGYVGADELHRQRIQQELGDKLGRE